MKNIRFYVDEFYQNFSYLATYVYAKEIKGHTARAGVMTISKICKVELPKNLVIVFICDCYLFLTQGYFIFSDKK